MESFKYWELLCYLLQTSIFNTLYMVLCSTLATTELLKYKYVKLNAEQKVCVQKAAIRCKYIENIESTDIDYRIYGYTN